MVQRVMGHQRSLTTLDLYTRRTDNSSRILDALNDPDEVPNDEDPDDGPEPVWAPGRTNAPGMLRQLARS